jgi:hypothetical protein
VFDGFPMKGLGWLDNLPVSLFEQDYVTVTVVRGGSRDEWGKPTPVERIEVPGCVLMPRAADVENQTAWSDSVGNQMLMYQQGFPFRSTDRIEVPEGQRMAGAWAILGRPAEWPGGSEILL